MWYEDQNNCVLRINSFNIIIFPINGNCYRINYYNVLQPRMTDEEFDSFFNKYQLDKNTDNEIINTFKNNSGSVNINEIIEIIKKIL